MQTVANNSDKKSSDLRLGQPAIFQYGKFDAATNMAIDESLLNLAIKTRKTFVRFYDFKKPTIILSSSDHPDNIRKENLNGTDVSRRESGGKPIYIDQNVLAYSIIGCVDSERQLDFSSPEKLHAYFGAIIAKAIAGIIDKERKVELGKSYSIRIDGKPIAGHGQRIKGNNSYLYHGVIAISDWDAERINDLLTLRREDYEDLKSLPSIKNLAVVKDRSIGYYKKLFMDNVLVGLCKNGDLKIIDPSEQEKILEAAMVLAKEKYSSADWVYKSSDSLKHSSRFCLLWEE